MGNTRNAVLLSAIMLIAIFLNLIILSYHPDLWWDEAVYISVGKYIYSFGDIGFFETLRPPVLPLTLGFLWLLDFNPIGFGKLIALLSHTLLIFLVYIVVKRIYRSDVAILSSAFLAFTPFVYLYSNKILTGILSGVFAMVAIYFMVKDDKPSNKNLFLSGLFAGIAFLTRFPGGLVFGGLLITLILKDIRRPKGMIKNLLFLLVGFFIVVSPYLIHSLFTYGSSIFPLIEASRQIESTPWFHNQDPLFYLKQLPLRNVFFVFSVLGLFYFFRRKDFKDFRKNTLLITFILFLLYFQYLEAKNIRFSLIFLSYLSLFSAYGIYGILKIFSKKRLTQLLVLVVLISFIFGVSVLYNSHIKHLSQPDPETPHHRFIWYFQENPVEGTILTSNIMIGAYTNNKLVSLYDWKFAKQIYDSYRGESPVLAIDTCSIVCESSDRECFDSKEEFIEYVRRENVERLHEESESCSYYIFEIK